MKRVIHINRYTIGRNVKNKTNDPAIIVRTYKGPKYGHTVHIKDNAGNTVATIIQSETPLSGCGARVWIETKNEVEIA